MKKIIKYVIIDILRSRIVIGFTLFLLLLSTSVFLLEDNSAKGILSLLNVVLIVVPLVGILFSSIYVYNSAEFLELLVSQPLRRRSIWLSIFLGLSVSLTLSFLVGAGLPILFFEPSATGLLMVISGALLINIFVALALLITSLVRDKAKGIGVVMLLWLYFSLLFDGIILFLVFQFSEYPLEKALIGVIALNPIDLSRILILLKMDVSALMGYTGAIFKDFFGTPFGIIFSTISLFIWIVIPVWFSVKRFNKKDL